MDKSHLAELRKQYRRLQGSVNYWNNGANAARRAADKHEGRRREDDMRRLVDFEKKAAAANKQLDGIKAQLCELDPHGARTRQLNALRSAQGRAKRELEYFEAMAARLGITGTLEELYQRRITKRRAKLAQLTEAMTSHRQETERLAKEQADRLKYQAEAEAIASAPYNFDPFDPAELEKLDARQAGRLVSSDRKFERQTPLKHHRPLH